MTTLGSPALSYVDKDGNVLTLVIPDDVTGTAAVAASIAAAGWQGAYSADTTYAVSAVVTGSDSGVYMSKVAANVGNDPTTSATQWQLLGAVPA